MNQEYSGTKLALLQAAGELFAEYGLEGASIRAIAEKANANIAAINYHFGSKESLFLAVLNHLMQENYRRINTDEYLARARTLRKPEEFSALIRDMVYRRFQVFFDSAEPEWHVRLFLRVFLESTELVENLVHDCFDPDMCVLHEIFHLANPRLNEDELDQFALGFMAHISFFCISRLPILVHLKQDKYSDSFLENTANHIAKLLTAGLGLPNPVQTTAAANN